MEAIPRLLRQGILLVSCIYQLPGVLKQPLKWGIRAIAESVLKTPPLI